MYRVGIDVGGTFTDYIAHTPDGRFLSGKTPSRPGEESAAVLDAIRRLANACDLTTSGFLERVDVLNFGTTVATNALLEGKGARCAMITTKGFRDILDVRRGHKESLFDLHLAAPPPLVRRRHRIGVTERVNVEGNIEIPLDENEVRAAVEFLRSEGARSYAVCLLQSPANPSHELRCADLVRRLHPDAFVTISSDVLNQMGEFERFSTTVLNAYLSPVLRDYLRQLSRTLAEHGFTGRLLVMQSNGGSSSTAEIAERGVGALLSGPAGGVVAATQVGSVAGQPNVIGVDMGGTSYDVSLVRDGQPRVRMDAWTARHRLGLPILDIHTIGAGGGSIAWIDKGGALRVGPESAGANPGPACYGRGGDRPTVSDANFVLGFLASGNFMSGEMSLDRSAAEDAIRKHIAEPLGVSVVEAAVGIHRIVNNNMSNGIRYVSVQRGHDPRDFALVAFGGAAPVHAPVQARDLGIQRILVPKAAGVLSAYGALLADLKVSALAPYFAPGDDADLNAVNKILTELWDQNRRSVAVSDVQHTERRYFVDFRYTGQVHELTVPLGEENGHVRPEDWSECIAAFHELHEQLYTFRLPDKPVESITLRCEVVGVREKLTWRSPAGDESRTDPVPKATRGVCFPRAGGESEFLDTPIYVGENLTSGQEIAGPAIIEEDSSTIVLYPGDRASIDGSGTYLVSVAAPPSEGGLL